MKLKPKHAYVTLIVALLFSGFPLLPIVKTQTPTNNNITYQPNSTPTVNVYYDDYSFVFEYKSYFIRVRPFVIYDGSFYGMKRIVQWIKNIHPNVNYKWLIDKAEKAIHYGFNLTKLPQNVADEIDYLGFRLVDLNFPLSWFKLEEVEFLTEGYNVTRIHIPKANLVFSFEDLYPQGYSVKHINKTYILIGDVRSKTDLIIDPITFSSDTIMVIGGTEGSPLDFEDVWDADKAGTYQLLSPSSISSPTDKNETRYFVDDYWEGLPPNGLEVWRLDLNQYPPSFLNITTGNATLLNGRWGIRVWKRHINETETELTSGIPVAQVNRSTASFGLQSALWNCPKTSLEVTDSIVVRAYVNITNLLDWTLMSYCTFTTLRLSGIRILASSWNISYYTYILLTGGAYQYRWYFDSGTYNSTIQNFAWTHVNSTSLDNQPRPAEDKALKLNVIITNLSTAGNVTINGQDLDGGEQSETIDVTANTTYTTTLWWGTVDTLGVVCYGDYTIEITQSRWGVVWKTGDAQFMFDAKIVFGNGTVAGTTWFNDTAKQITFNDGIVSANNEDLMRVYRYATVTFGELIDATKKLGRNGVSYISLESTRLNTQMFRLEQYAEMYWYSSHLSAPNKDHFTIAYQNSVTRLWNCLVHRAQLYGYGFDLFDVTMTGTKTGTGLRPLGAWSMNQVLVTNVVYGLWTQGGAGITLENLYARGCTNIARSKTIADNVYLVNPDVDTWSFLWTGESAGEIYRQYTFDLTISYMNFTLMQNANVTISNSYLGTSDSWLTYANGSIPQQTYSYGHYNQTGDDSLYDYNPYNVTVTKDGLQTYTALYNITEKTDLTIALQESTAAVTYTSAILIASLFLLVPIAVIIIVWRYGK